MTKQKWRSYTREFKEEAVKLISEKGYSYAEAGRNLGVNPNQLNRWKREIEGDNGDPESTISLQTELKRLRKENKRLKLEGEIFKKATLSSTMKRKKMTIDQAKDTGLAVMLILLLFVYIGGYNYLILPIIFYIVVTPIGLFRKLLGADSMRVGKWKQSNESVFLERNHTYSTNDLNKPY